MEILLLHKLLISTTLLPQEKIYNNCWFSELTMVNSQELAPFWEIFKYFMPVKYLSLLPRGLGFLLTIMTPSSARRRLTTRVQPIRAEKIWDSDQWEAVKTNKSIPRVSRGEPSSNTLSLRVRLVPVQGYCDSWFPDADCSGPRRSQLAGWPCLAAQ